MIESDGCWADYRMTASDIVGRRCLFLDRDGVLIEDTGYPHDPASVVLIPETLDLVQAANASGMIVGIVSNQSGIGRGYFGWNAFSAVQEVIDAALAERAARLDFVLACPHLPDAPVVRYRHDRHPWRKPASGMLTAAGRRLGLDLTRSAMVGDRPSDMAAAAGAGLPYRALLSDADPANSSEAWRTLRRDALARWFRDDVAGPARQR